jgi:phage I-like protein
MLRERGENMVNQKKRDAAREIAAVGAAIRRAAEKLEDSSSGVLVNYFQNAAEKIDSAARYIDERELNEVAEDVTTFVRKRPAIAASALLIAGLAAGRFLKATKPRSRQRNT